MSKFWPGYGVSSVFCAFSGVSSADTKESYRKYLKFFGNLILVLLLLQPAASLLGQAESLEQFLKFQTLSNEYSELRMHMEGMEELKNTLVEKTFRREIERQIREVPENLGYSVLSLSVSYGETGEPEAIDLVLLSSKDEGTAKIQEELCKIYGLAGEEIRITVKEA
ncbi:MAG: stage III sporulation protein AF [Lachnospiraceae bacterium]